MIASLPTSGQIHAPEVAFHDGEGLERARKRAALALTLAFWISGYLLQVLATALSGNDRLVAIAGMRIATTLIGLCFCYLIHRILAHPRLDTNKRRLIALAIASPILAETYAWIAFFALGLVDPTLSLANFTWSGAVQTISFWTWFFLAWSGLYLALMYSFDVRAEQQRSAELREQAHVAQLRALHSQINPHFLFNSLNSVSALILDQRSEKAEEMVGKLARFLRLGLAADPTKTIPLAMEIELQASYLEIEQLRYPDLTIEIRVPEDLKEARVPALILQPIVENAVKFGVAGAPPPASIAIRAWHDEMQLKLEVIDAGKGKAASPGTGIGLNSVRQRLGLIYGEGRVDLHASRQGDQSFRVVLTMPLRMA